MAKLFDKVSGDFLNSIKSVMEKTLTSAEMKKREEVAKAIERDNPSMSMSKKMAIATATAKKVAEAKLDPVNHKELEGTHAQRKDKDINNDGKVDKSDEYLHARRKAVKHAISKKMKEEAEQIDEISTAMKSRYKKAAQHSLDQAQDFKSELDHEGEPKDSRVRKDVNRIIKNRKTGMKRANEEVEQIDEISTKLAIDYTGKAADSRGHKNLSTAKLDKRYKSMALAHEKIRGRHANVPTTEEVDLTPEEIEMIEAKMAGVADGALPGDEHMCATKVFHKEWKEGTPVPTMHADPDENGLIEWYDVMFDHGIERVMTEDMEILDERSHGHKRMKEEVEELDELSKGTLASYAKKAMKDAPEKDRMGKAYSDMAADDAKRGEREGASHYGKRAAQSYTKAANRRAGTMKAIDKLAKEEVKLDEMSSKMKMKLGLYGKKKKMKEEAEQIDETAKVVAHLQKRYGDNIRKSHVRSAANDFGVGYVALAHAVRKKLGVNRLEEEQVDEARGRPKKESGKEYTVHPVTKEKMMHNNPQHMKRIENLYRIGALKKPKTEADQNIVTQLRKASTSMRGGETVHFSHGPSKHVGADVARKALDKHADMKPAEKEAFQKKISHSHEHLMKHI